MPAPLFLLAPPRSYTSLVNAMIGQHPQAFGVPELCLFNTERLVDLCLAFRQAGLEPKRLQLVYARVGQPAQLALVEAVRGGRPGLAVAPPLVLYEGAGRSYTKQALRWYGGDARSEKGGERDV